MREKTVLRVGSKFLIPFVLIFALYVQWHGDFGPGGGFQAGVIFAAAFILYALMFGAQTTRKVMPPWLTRFLLCLGVLIYSGTGLLGMYLGGNFLDYFVLASDPVTGQERGILWVEFGVGVTVFAAMITIFLTFAGQDTEQ